MSSIAIKRLSKDLKDVHKAIENKSLVGVSIQPVKEDLFCMHANITVLGGPYEGFDMHVVFRFKENHPISSPSGNMLSPFGQREHEHVHGNSICMDFLSNFESYFKSIDGGTIKAGYGWTPATSLTQLLIAVQQFFIDPDLKSPLTKSEVNELMVKLVNYKCEECECSNVSSSPSPSPSTSSPLDSVPSVTDLTIVEKTIDVKRIENILFCPITSETVFDEGVILGYPIDSTQKQPSRPQNSRSSGSSSSSSNSNKNNLSREHSGKFMEMTLIPEIMSYVQIADSMMNNSEHRSGSGSGYGYGREQFRSTSGKSFTDFLPCYINKEHYKRAYVHINNAISILSGNTRSGDAAYDFQPAMVLRVLPALMNKTVVNVSRAEMHESESMIMAYCHLLHLFLSLCRIYSKQLIETIHTTVANFVNDDKMRCKQVVPDIGEFIILLSVQSLLVKDKKQYSINDPQIKRDLLQEYFARQVFWINKADPSVYNKSVSVTDKVKRSFDASIVSNRLLVFHLMFAKYFISDNVETYLNANFGIPPQNVIDDFQQIIKRIKMIDKYSTLFTAIEFNEIKDINQMDTFLKKAYDRSRYNGYT